MSKFAKSELSMDSGSFVTGKSCKKKMRQKIRIKK